MARVKIVCDASFDDKLRLTGYAGGLYISDDQHHNHTYMYQGVGGEYIDIQEGELAAILCGLRELSRRERLGQVQVGSLQIFTDSKTAVQGLSGKRSVTSANEENYRPWFNKIHEIAQQKGWALSVEHVSAHVPVEQASGIERLNHIADQRASDIRKASLESILKPALDESRYVSVLLPKKPKDKSESSAWASIAHAMVMQRRHVRLHIPGANSKEELTSHPFVLSILRAAKDEGVSFRDFLTIMRNNPAANHSGMDYVLLRYHADKQGQDSTFSLKGEPSEKTAAFSSRLLFGDTSPEATNMNRPSGRSAPASSRVYDLLNPLPRGGPRPQTVQGYLHTFLDYVKIPKIEGVTNALRDLGVVPPANIQDRAAKKAATNESSTNEIPDDRLKSDLKSVYEAYKDQLPPDQMVTALVDVISQHGKVDSKLFRGAMERFIYISLGSDPETMINRIVSHARRLDPSLQPPPFPKKEDLPEPTKPNGDPPGNSDPSSTPSPKR